MNISELEELVIKVVILEYNANIVHFRAKYERYNIKKYTYDLVKYNTECRDRGLVTIRQTCMVIIGEINKKLTTTQIGAVFNKDHGTYLFAKKTIANLIYSDSHFNKFYNDCLNRLTFYKKNTNLFINKSFIKALSVVRNYGSEAVKELINKFFD